MIWFKSVDFWTSWLVPCKIMGRSSLLAFPPSILLAALVVFVLINVLACLSFAHCRLCPSEGRNSVLIFSLCFVWSKASFSSPLFPYSSVWLLFYTWNFVILLFAFSRSCLPVGECLWWVPQAFLCVLDTHCAVFILLSLFQIAQALKPWIRRGGFWGSVRTLARGYEIIMGLLLFTPIAFLAWFPFVSEFQTRMLFNQAFSRGLQISRILGGPKKDRSSSNKE